MPWLMCMRGDDRGVVEELTEGQEIVLGREEACNIRLLTASASRRHCLVTLKGSQLLVQDLGSSHGTKRRGKRFKGKSFKIKPSEQFEVGGDCFEFIHTYEQYVEAIDRVKDGTNMMEEKDLRANYSQLIAEATRTKQFPQRKKSLLSRVLRVFGFGM